MPPTQNVSYTGTIDKLGASIYMQGTHQLVLGDGQLIILSSTDANLSLDTYLGKHVEVRGSVQPTVEGDGMIMRVEVVTVLDASSATTSSEASSVSSAKFCGGIAAFPCDGGYMCVDNPDDSCDPMNGGADCSGICVPETSSSSAMTSSAATSVKSSSSAVSKASSTAVSSVASSTGNSAAMEAQIQTMAKQSYTQDSLWTQKYCTSHVAFCIPAHKNWYFKSFGATTSNMWHVEFGMTTIDELHQGAITLNLVSGTSAAAGVGDGQIKVQGSDIVGYKDWTDNTHFELIADARLRDAVSYMLAHILAYNPGE